MKANMKTNMKPNMMANMKANMKAIMKANMKANVLSVCSYRPISAVSLLLSYWLFFERSIFRLLWLSCYLSSYPSHRGPTLSSNPLRCLCSVFSGTLSFVYSIQIVVVSDDTTTVCLHLFVFYLPSTECSPPLSSTTESDSVFYSRCLP